jgi:hypothetical protein
MNVGAWLQGVWLEQYEQAFSKNDVCRSSRTDERPFPGCAIEDVHRADRSTLDYLANQRDSRQLPGASGHDLAARR